MKSVYAKAVHDYDVRDIQIPKIDKNDVLVKVKACGLCGTDVRFAMENEEYTPLGHEVSGIVEAIGSNVSNVKIGDKVCLESGTFDRFSTLSRDGKPDLDMTGRSMFLPGNESMGFAEYISVPCETCVPFSGLSFEQASLIEPMGVAYDLWKVTDINLGDHVIVYGCGPIGLLALRLAKLSGAGRIYAVNTSGRDARDEIAKRWGADEIIHNDKVDLLDYKFEKGGVDRILMTAPPTEMPNAMKIMNLGGIMGFIGIGSGPAQFVSFDMRHFHDDKLQIRASNAVPALYFPACIELCKSGAVKIEELISHTLSFDSFGSDVKHYLSDRANALKAISVL